MRAIKNRLYGMTRYSVREGGAVFDWGYVKIMGKLGGSLFLNKGRNVIK
jgi:hypothetical protein